VETQKCACDYSKMHQAGDEEREKEMNKNETVKSGMTPSPLSLRLESAAYAPGVNKIDALGRANA
jgi:hypothetical protein